MQWEESFIPKDKPKSWVIFNVSGLIGLLVAVPIFVLGACLESEIVENIGTRLLLLCLIVGIPAWLIFAAGMVSGKYRSIKTRKWRQQIW